MKTEAPLKLDLSSAGFGKFPAIEDDIEQFAGSSSRIIAIANFINMTRDALPQHVQLLHKWMEECEQIIAKLKDKFPQEGIQ